MNFKDLAEELIKTKKESERKILFKDILEADFLKLAQALRDTYYESWTNEPQRVQKAAEVLKSLVKLKSTEEIKALSFWVSGIAYLTKGKLDSAINNLNKSAEIFQAINKEYESAQTQVAKLYPLALLGRYDEAVKCGKHALKVFVKFKQEIEAGKIENNIGNIYWRRDLHLEAETYYLSALKRFQKLKEISLLAMTENGLASNYSSLNDFRNAEIFYEKALLHSQESKLYVRQAEIEVNIGKLALFRGKFDQALLFLEKSRRKYEELKMPHQVAVAELEVADIYLELNLVGEAFGIYQRVAKSFAELKMQGEEARSRANFGRAAIFLRKFDFARLELGKAAKLYFAEQNLVGAAIVKINEAQLEFTEKNYKLALKLAIEAENLLNKTANSRHKLTTNWVKAECFINLKKFDLAQKLLKETFADAVKQENGQIAQVAQISLGKLASIENKLKQAERYFKRAIELIETLRAPLPAEEFRMAFLANKLAPYQSLAKIYLAENKPKKAFLMIEKARSRSLVENLGGIVQPLDNQQNKVSAKLSKKLEVLREELNWFYSRLNRADNSEIENLQTEAKRREKEIADVMRQISSTDESKFSKQDFLDFARLQEQLGKQKALVEFVNFDGEISAFVITDKKIHFVADLAKESEILALLEGLQFQFGSLRYGAKILGSFMPELKKRADFYLQKLYEKLIEPLESFLDNRDLTLVPVGALHYVPFHALFDGTGYQIEKREIVYAPSATVWQFLASKPQQKLRNALLIGFADEHIPLVGREIKNLKRIFANSKSFTGKRATFSAFTKNAAKFDVLHLACHGQFRPENPLFSSLHLADGFVTVRDICLQELKAEIVTLSACETGLSKIFAGDEILGLARGFLSAGAKSLVLSLWTVNDGATVDLMRIFYEELQTGKSASEALKISQCNFIERGVHPYFWSPFALIGS